MTNPDAQSQGVPSTPIVLLSDWGRCGESPVERQLIAFDQMARPHGARAISCRRSGGSGGSMTSWIASPAAGCSTRGRGGAPMSIGRSRTPWGESVPGS